MLDDDNDAMPSAEAQFVDFEFLVSEGLVTAGRPLAGMLVTMKETA